MANIWMPPLCRRGFLGVGGAILLLPLIARPVEAGEEGAKGTIDNFTFSPQSLTVRVGETVTWTNQDDIPHSILCEALNLKSKALDTDQSFSHRFDQARTFPYVCGIHPHMKGTIIVAPA